MDFEEIKNESHSNNVKKNRITMLLLFALFIIPVLLAYAAYFNGWFDNATKNRGELLTEKDIVDIEDYTLIRAEKGIITGKEFETLYWWIIPVDLADCDLDCLKLNLHTLNQTYVGLGKESERINQLLILANDTQVDIGDFPMAFSEFSNIGVKANSKTNSGLNKDLPANFIYLVDPLGNVFMRYPLVRDPQQAVEKSKDLRKDILHLFKYSRLG